MRRGGRVAVLLGASLQTGITCTVIATGKGFRIDRAGVRPVGS